MRHYQRKRYWAARATWKKTRASRARAVFMDEVCRVLVLMAVAVMISMTCRRCQGSMFRDGYGELRCVHCGHVAYPARAVLE